MVKLGVGLGAKIALAGRLEWNKWEQGKRWKRKTFHDVCCLSAALNFRSAGFFCWRLERIRRMLLRLRSVSTLMSWTRGKEVFESPFNMSKKQPTQLSRVRHVGFLHLPKVGAAPVLFSMVPQTAKGIASLGVPKKSKARRFGVVIGGGCIEDRASAL